MAGLVKSLDSMRGHLLEEPGYRQYIREVERVKKAYGRIQVARLEESCLSGPASIAERAIDQYVRAANTWSRCIADAGCDLERGRARVAKQWWIAGLTVSDLHRALPS